jgi:hypothetical protein
MGNALEDPGSVLTLVRPAQYRPLKPADAAYYFSGPEVLRVVEDDGTLTANPTRPSLLPGHVGWHGLAPSSGVSDLVVHQAGGSGITSASVSVRASRFGKVSAHAAKSRPHLVHLQLVGQLLLIPCSTIVTSLSLAAAYGWPVWTAEDFSAGLGPDHRTVLAPCRRPATAQDRETQVPFSKSRPGRRGVAPVHGLSTGSSRTGLGGPLGPAC